MRQRGCVAWPQGKSFIGESHGGDGGAADHPSARQPACRRAAVLRTGVLRSADRGTGVTTGLLSASLLAAAGLGVAGLGVAFVVERLPWGICARPAAKPPLAASFSASAAICWNWLGRALPHCNGSATGSPAALDVCPAVLAIRPAAPGA